MAHRPPETSSVPRPWVWQTDSYGVDNLHDDMGRHLWVMARRPYCDRGHWEVGSLGPMGAARPSMYFHHVDLARAEAERWLVQALGQAVPVSAMKWPRGWVKGDAPEGGRRWSCSGPHGEAVFQLAPVHVAGQPMWELSVVAGLDRPGNHLDEADRFPRHFFDPATAVRETQAFARWRLFREPVTTPGPLVLPDRPVDRSTWKSSPETSSEQPPSRSSRPRRHPSP